MAETCVCGFAPPGDPNPDCERCQLLATIARLEQEIKTLRGQRNLRERERDEARATVARLERERDEAVKVLLEIEWGSFEEADWKIYRTCPSCEQRQSDGHTESCDLKACLNRL